MHDAAYQWIRRHAVPGPVTVLDIGGRNVNGSPRDLFPAAKWTALDIEPGDGVDVVADAASWWPDQPYDVVVCAEVFEHTPVWPHILNTVFTALKPGGLLIATMAGPGRAPHSAVDGGPALRPNEWYANISPAALGTALKHTGYVNRIVEQAGVDVRCTARKPGG